jgi:hypothetical protein
MRIPQQVSERVKEAPAQALRAVFSGIGQVLLVADRIKNRAAEPDRARPAAAGPAAQPRPPADPVVRDETRWRSLDATGNVRLLSQEDAAKAGPPDATAPAPAPEPAPAPSPEPAAAAALTPEPPAEAALTTEPPAPEATAEHEAAAEPAKTAPDAPKAAEPAVLAETSLPVPNYDSLTVASLRARLRNLDRSQVELLLAYEKANAGRAEVLTMFERRIAKLDGSGA